jgi:hypothetical protein
MSLAGTGVLVGAGVAVGEMIWTVWGAQAANTRATINAPVRKIERLILWILLFKKTCVYLDILRSSQSQRL